MTAWLLAGRLARRQARRRPVRSALVVGLIGLPVAGVVIGSTLARTTAVTPEQARRWAAGNADAVLTRYGEPNLAATSTGDVAALLGTLPPGTRAVVSRGTSDLVRTTDGSLAPVDVRDVPLDHPLTAGVRVLRSGRAPARPGELAVSPAVLRATGARPGGALRLARSSRRGRITGVVVDPADLDALVAVTADAIDGDAPEATTRVYVSLPDGAAGLDLADGRLRSRFAPGFPHVVTGTGRLAAVRLFGGVALAVATIVAAAAFAVSNRRHLRELGLLGASGAAPNHLVRAMAVEGVVLGAAGALAGLVLGLVAVAALAPRVDTLAGHLTGGVRVAPGEYAVVALLGVAAAAIAGWTNARSAYWLPVLAALAGRRPLGRVPGWVPAGGLALVAVGIGLLAWVNALSFGSDLWSFSLAGGVAVLLGGVALTPWLVAGLERSSRRLGGTARLALRSLARNRVRSAAVVAAVLAAGSLAVAASAALLGQDASGAMAFTPSVGPSHVLVSAAQSTDAGDPARTEPVAEPRAVEAVGRILPGAVVAERRRLVLPPAGGADPATSFTTLALPTPADPAQSDPSLTPATVHLGDIWVARPKLVAAIDPPEPARAALARGEVVALGPVDQGRVTASLSESGTVRERLPVVVRRANVEQWGTVLVPPRRVAELGLVARFDSVLVRAPRSLTDAQRHDLRELSVELFDRYAASPRRFVNVIFREPPATSGRLRALVLGGALLFTLGVVALGLALVAAEGRQEQAVIRAMGAPPRLQARLRAVQAAALAGIGGVLAVPIGFAPVATYLGGSGGGPVVFPTGAALCVAVVIPLAVAVLTGAASRAAAGRAPSLVSFADD